MKTNVSFKVHSGIFLTQSSHGDLESIAGFADHVVNRNLAVLEDEVAGRRSTDAQFILFFTQGKSLSRLGHHEGRDATVLQAEIKSNLIKQGRTGSKVS